MKSRRLAIAFGLIPLLAWFPPAARPEGAPVYRSQSYAIYSDHIVRDGRVTRVDRKTGEVASEGLAQPAPRRPRAWRPAHDLSSLPRFTCAYPVFNAAWRMALDDTLKNVNENNLFNAGSGYAVWVRDSAYASLLASAFLFPKPTRASLEGTVKAGGTVEPEQMYADIALPYSMTPRVGQPYSLSDFVVWIPGAWEYARATGDLDFIRRHWDDMARTFNLLDQKMFDPADCLYNGGAFGDGPNAYPEGKMGWAALKGTSTNALHYAANRAMAEMGDALGIAPAQTAPYFRRARALRESINEKLWLEPQGFYAQLKIGDDPILAERTEALAEALPILFGIADLDRSRRMLKAAPDSEWGIPLLWPIYGNRPLYHDQAVWPFTEAFWSVANARMGKPRRLMKGIASLTQMALFERNFKEFISLAKGDGRDKDHQLWSACGYLAMMLKGLFGVEALPQGLLITPAVPREFAAGISLDGLHYRQATLDLKVRGSGANIASFRLDGQPALNFIPAKLTGPHRIEITMSESSPFGVVQAPEAMGQGSAIPVMIRPAGGKRPRMALYVLNPSSSNRPVRVPLAPASGSNPGGGLSASIGPSAISSISSPPPRSLMLAPIAEDRGGAVRAIGRWRTVDLPAPIGARFDPGAILSRRPLTPGQSLRLSLRLRNNTPTTQPVHVEWSLPPGLELASAENPAPLAPFTTARVGAAVSTRRAFDYGVYPLKALVTCAQSSTSTTTVEIPLQIAETLDLRGTWLMKNTSQPDAASPECFDSDFSWKWVFVPGSWKRVEGFEKYEGEMWYRYHVLVPAEWRDHDLEFYARRIGDHDVTWFNGAKVGETQVYRQPRHYVIPAARVKPGQDNVIALKIKNIGGMGGLLDWPIELRVLPKKSPAGQ